CSFSQIFEQIQDVCLSDGDVAAIQKFAWGEVIDHVTDQLFKRAGLDAFFGWGVAELFDDYALGARVFNVLGRWFPPVMLALSIVDAGDLACKLLTGGGCRWDVWNLFIDPSGNVVDTNGNPISGASATLLSLTDGSFAP